MRAVFVILIALFLFACPEGGTEKTVVRSAYCHVVSAIYLLTGDIIPKSGPIEDPFIDYHELNPNAWMYETEDIEEARDAYDQGRRVVVRHRDSGEWHFEPWYGDSVPKTTSGFYIAGG